ncbi:acetylornithine aminotransferase ArgD [Desulfotignum phosphitoxidans DSM 13687]|uniref:Acetylornithine aminotransferase ArgD n=2 Tax=Desulfotignum phosphitoxidans TaxID=190898 RepID=S0G0N3_9BACT|nr:acetylornithine aminotransferase ArgD [Desulfotignum phosphitoxidans DSM 13687]
MGAAMTIYKTDRKGHMEHKYLSIRITTAQAEQIAGQLYQVSGDIMPLPGELDFNFKITGNGQSYILKISRPEVSPAYIEFQQALLGHVNESREPVVCPETVPARDGKSVTRIVDDAGTPRLVRLLSWIDGRLWSDVNPITDRLLESLGRQAGQVTKALQGFDHDLAHRDLVWDLAQADWTRDHQNLFSGEQREIIDFFLHRFIQIQPDYHDLRKSVVHNDANDNNVVVTEDRVHPEVTAIIDYGDAVYTQTVNDLAVTVAYAVMGKPEPLAAALCVVKGYHMTFPLEAKELALLHTLVAVRLVISVTKSALNRVKEPENTYLLISEKPAWDLLTQWRAVDEALAHYSFRQACGMMPHPGESGFVNWAGRCDTQFSDLLGNGSADSGAAPVPVSVDLSVGSPWLGHAKDYTDPARLAFELGRLSRQQKGAVPAGGYLECRTGPFLKIYEAGMELDGAIQAEGNTGPVYRTLHLGMDVWAKQGTPVYALFDGRVVQARMEVNESPATETEKETEAVAEGEKGTETTTEIGVPAGSAALILAHRTPGGMQFYTLYGGLDPECLNRLEKGRTVEKGELLGGVARRTATGNRVPHLHFQVMLDRPAQGCGFPRVMFLDQREVWKSISPDPNLFFKDPVLERNSGPDTGKVLSFRRRHLGKSLSLSYETPLKIVRGSGAFLVDETGRPFLDTVNNVAHVGHEHPRVVKAGQAQMAVLNTNTRYLHDSINRFAEALLGTFPDELSVVHFVNSGSEANELALRMARAATGHRDMIAVEVGYHGNTGACIDISSYKFDGKGGKGAPAHTHIVPLPDAFRGLYRGRDTGEKYAAHIREQIQQVHAAGRGVAGFICESIISCGGQIELPDGYLKTAYEAVRKAGGVCIADEVQVGCGRVGHAFWAFELHGVVPDIVTIGKPIGNGHPLAAVVCTRKVAEAFANGMEYFNTFGGNPVSCAIGREVLQVIADEGLQENALATGEYLKEELRNLRTSFPIIGDVRGQGLFLGFELVDDHRRPLGGQAEYLANRMRDLGILMSTDGRDHNVLKIKPPAVFSRTNADELLFRLETVLGEDAMAV